MFSEIIDRLMNDENVDYSKIESYVTEIINEHETLEKRVYDLEHDVKIRDEEVERLKSANYDLETTAKENVKESEEVEEEVSPTIDEIVKVEKGE